MESSSAAPSVQQRSSSRGVFPGFLEVEHPAVLTPHAFPTRRCAVRNQDINLNPLLLPLASALSKKPLPRLLQPPV